MGWFPPEAEYDQLSLYELDEFNTVIRQKMERSI
jgi:hypothetical protein